jgi:hypothetical protein
MELNLIYLLLVFATGGVGAYIFTPAKDLLDLIKKKETDVLVAKQTVIVKEAELNAIKQEISRFQNVVQVAEQPTDVKAST